MYGEEEYEMTEINTWREREDNTEIERVRKIEERMISETPETNFEKLRII